MISIHTPTGKALLVVFSAVHFNLFVSFLFFFSFLFSPRLVSRADYSRFDFYSSSALEVLVLLWSLSTPLLLKHCSSFSSCEAICLIVLFFSFQSTLLSGPGDFRYDFCSSASLEVLVSFFLYIEITKKREKKIKSSRKTEIPYCLSIASFVFIAATSGSAGYSWYDFRLLCCCWVFGALWSLSRACKHCKSVFYRG